MNRIVATLLLTFGVTGALLAQQQVQPVAGVLTLNLAPGVNSFKVILSANVTSTVITNPTPGTVISVIFTENATGGFTVAFGGNISNPCTVTTTANATTTCQFQYDATSNTWNGVGGGSSTPTPGVFNSTFDPPLFQNYTLTATGAQAAINLTANPIDTHTISWRVSGTGSLPSSVVDAFPYANGDLHAANALWVYQTSGFTVSSNVAYGSSASGLAYRSDGVNTANEFAQETVVETATSGTQNHGPCVRIQSASYSGYCIQLATDIFRILVWNSGTSTTLATFPSSLAISGDVVKLVASGTTLSAFKNGVLIGSITDSTWTTGLTGMFSNGNATSNGASNFQSGQLGSCSIQLDSSVDGVTWTAGGAIPSQNCTNSSSSSQASVVANYVRVNLTALASGLTVTVVYSGRLAPATTSTGTAPVSNGQWVNAGQILWTQITTNGGTGNISVSTSSSILLPNGTTSNNVSTVGGTPGSGGFGFGYVIPTSGWLQGATTQINSGGFPQGTFYIQHILMATLPIGGTTNSLTGSFTTYTGTNPIILDCATVGSFFAVSFVGTTVGCQSPWSIPGYTTTTAVSNPAAGAEWSLTLPTVVRTCIQSVSFTLVAGSTNVTPVIVITLNGSKLVYPASTAQTSGTTQTYSFSPGASESVTAGSTIFHIVPFNNGQLACSNSGLTTATISTLTTGINGTTQYSNISLLTQVQQDNN